MLGNLRDKLPSFSFSLSTTPNDITTWQYLFLGLIVFFGCFYGMGAYSILDMNEGLYAEVAREMIAGGHWIVPYLNGAPYLEKPPLLYWLLTISYHIFGVNAFAARLIPSLATALTALLFFYTGKKLGTARTGWIAAIIMCSSLVFLMIGRTVFFDPLLMYLMAGSLLTFYFWHQEKKTNYLYASYVFLALAILTKGFVSLVFIPLIAFIYLFLVKADKEDYKALFNKKALILFLVIAAPWHVMAMLANPRFIWEYVMNQQVLRFFNASTPHDYHTGPLYFYIPRVIGYLLPWSIFLIFTVWPLKLKRPLNSLTAFLWTWFLVVFIFFSLSGDKGDYYAVIGSPPLAYLIAQKIEEWFVSDKARWLMLIYAGLTIALAGAGLFAVISPGLVPALYQSGVLLLCVTVLVFAVGGIYLCLHNKGRPMVPFLLLALLIIPLMMFYLSVRERSQFLYSQKSVALFVKNQYQARPVYMYQHYDKFSSFVFYAGFTCPVIDSKSSDLYFGSTTNAGKAQFISMQDFMAKSKKEFLYVLMTDGDWKAFEKTPDAKPFCPVSQSGHVVLLSNSPEDCQATIQVGEQKDLNLQDFKKGQGVASPSASPSTSAPAVTPLPSIEQ